VRVLLTGATGFVGAETLEQLLNRGDEVRVLALADTVEQLRHRDRVDLVIGNLSDSDALAAATRAVEVVYHLAAIHLSALRATADPGDLRIVNVDGTARLLRACRLSAVRRIVFTSSVAVYNAAPWPFMWPIHETHPMRTTGEDNLRNYALSKIEAEDLVRRAHQEQGIQVVVLRSTAVYGPAAPWVERTIRALAANPASALTRAGRFACNQWINRRDLARAVVLGGTARDLQYEVCNVAGPELFSARDVLIAMSRALGQKTWAGLPTPELETTARYAYRYDMSRAQTRLGFAPRVKLDEGIGEVLAAMSPPPDIAQGFRDPGRQSPFSDVELS
jgi:UDP-glucose 4-epimerase